VYSLWIVAAGLAFSLMGVCVKYATAFTAAELVFWRSLGTLALCWVLCARQGITVRTTRFGMHTHRGVAGFTSLFMFFYALTELPVATAMSLSYTSPLFVALLWTVLTRVRPNAALIASLAIGFLGTALLLRPSLGADQWKPAMVCVTSAAFASVAFWNVQQLVRVDEPVPRVVFYFALFSTVGAFVWMVPHAWHVPSRDDAWSLAGVIVFGTAGQVMLTEAYGKGRPLVAAALSYSGVVFSAVLGTIVLGENLPLIAWAGIALIVAAGMIALRYGPGGPPAETAATND
jgi:drug/metabolite transporter (DMT)-like permease